MPLIFVISGASLFFALGSRGAWKFIDDKVKRIVRAIGHWHFYTHNVSSVFGAHYTPSILRFILGIHSPLF